MALPSSFTRNKACTFSTSSSTLTRLTEGVYENTSVSMPSWDKFGFTRNAGNRKITFLFTENRGTRSDDLTLVDQTTSARLTYEVKPGSTVTKTVCKERLIEFFHMVIANFDDIYDGMS